MTILKPIDFVVGGKVVSESMLLDSATKRQPKARAEVSEYHKGYRVVGHPPGALEAAAKFRAEQLALWSSYDEEDRRRAKKRGEKEPRPWDEEQWRRNTHKKPIRSKPYEIPTAADLCAEMARKAGWIDVEVVAIVGE